MGFWMGPGMARGPHAVCTQSNGWHIVLCLDAGGLQWVRSGGKAEGERPCRRGWVCKQLKVRALNRLKRSGV